jgi:hypothetical protein
MWRRYRWFGETAGYRAWTPIDRVFRPDPLLPPAHLRVYYYRSTHPRAFQAACDTVKASS